VHPIPGHVVLLLPAGLFAVCRRMPVAIYGSCYCTGVRRRARVRAGRARRRDTQAPLAQQYRGPESRGESLESQSQRVRCTCVTR
jgi:hypothetical protein